MALDTLERPRVATSARTTTAPPDWRVTLSDLVIDENEVEAVAAVLRSRWLSAGPVTRAFEREFAAVHGVEDAVAVSSGTAALHLAMLALGIGPGDEVIVPSLSFVSAAAVVALCGGTPVFADVADTCDLTVDPADVARRVTPRTKAIVAMHFGGFAADMDGILAVARRHGLAVVEDAAHAPGVRTGAGALGTIGDIGCFSFFATKNVATGEGGMVVARDPSVLARIRQLRSHCMTTSSWDKQQGRPAGYDVVGLGLNYRPTEMSSALGRVQLSRLPDDRRRRCDLTTRYRRLLAELPGVDLPFFHRTGDSAYHLMPLLLPDGVDRECFQEQLKRHRIQSSVHYPPSHLFSHYQAAYGYQPGDLPVTEDVAAREVTLPLHARMRESDVDLVAGVAAMALARCLGTAWV
ncbi:MAG TPA: DegT/DnrJ/EryC1/StrS family aminotransferase [Acidimicrobiales bacterium]|jgi:dTDP-4-amino-4,6-dideoxygalactose transaminase